MKCRGTEIIIALLETLPRILTTLGGLRNVVALVFALRTTSSFTLCSPHEKLPNLNLTFFILRKKKMLLLRLIKKTGKQMQILRSD